MRTIVTRTNQGPSQGQTGQNGDFTVEFCQKVAGLSQGRVPICPKDGTQFVPGLSQGPSRPKRLCFGSGKRGHSERGLFTEGISRISKISKFSRVSRKWLAFPLISTVWRVSKISRISRFSRISRKWTFLKRPLFQKTPFSEPECLLVFSLPDLRTTTWDRHG